MKTKQRERGKDFVVPDGLYVDEHNCIPPLSTCTTSRTWKISTNLSRCFFKHFQLRWVCTWGKGGGTMKVQQWNSKSRAISVFFFMLSILVALGSTSQFVLLPHLNWHHSACRFSIFCKDRFKMLLCNTATMSWRGWQMLPFSWLRLTRAARSFHTFNGLSDGKAIYEGALIFSLPPAP